MNRRTFCGDSAGRRPGLFADVPLRGRYLNRPNPKDPPC